ncbi:hypothetical protein CC2G_003775 [Coprinopsis cinerea AmutBmut pab1-1]|nr:hypothetical protein CC2G_003775 [Coprinopsis cinerea AmutBmut pab1-1]
MPPPSPTLAPWSPSSTPSATPNVGLLTPFLIFHLFTVLGGLVMLTTAIFCSSRVPRQPVWFSFISSFVIYSGSFALLVFTGYGFKGEGQRSETGLLLGPGFGVCLAQAAMQYSALPFTSATTFALVAQVFFNIKNWVKETMPTKRQENLLLFFLGAPYILYVGMLTSFIVIGLLNPTTVQLGARDFYCSFIMRVPARITSILVAVLMIPTVVLNSITLYHLRGNWNLLRGSVRRVMAFSVVGVLAIVFVSLLTLEMSLGADFHSQFRSSL